MCRVSVYDGFSFFNTSKFVAVENSVVVASFCVLKVCYHARYLFVSDLLAVEFE